MNKVNYALAMLTAAGGSAAVSTTAHAAVLYGDFRNTTTGYNETFDIQTTGTPESDTDYTDFALTNDSMGNTIATAGNETTGFKGSSIVSNGYFGTGGVGSSEGVNQMSDQFKPPLYTSTVATPVLHGGTYQSIFQGGFTLSLVPEPDAWALLIAGAAMTGGALRASRRRSRVATA